MIVFTVQRSIRRIFITGPLLVSLLSFPAHRAGGQAASLSEPEITLHDANPRFTGGQYLGQWDAQRLATVAAPREGAATDGVSRLLVRVEVSGAGRVEVELINARPENGSLRSLSGTEAVRVGDRYLAFALYTPPSTFGPGSEAEGSWHDEVDFRGVGILARHRRTDGTEAEAGSAIILTRPPLVLVHGTFDNPVAAWRTESDLGPAPVEAFSAAGFRPFTVDYSGSSAAPTDARTGRGVRPDESWLNPGESSFRSNRRVVLENPDGILDALAHYRDQLGIAAARADVVGHSLGGTLGRVLASSNYNPDYRTAENFNQGWINRLVTVNTPHHGTELPAMLSFFADAQWREGRSWTEWFLTFGIRLAAWWEGRSASAANAVRDQLPLSKALQDIDSTPVPAHAVVGTMDMSRLGDDTPTLGLFTGIGTTFYYFPGLLSDFLDHLATEWATLPARYRMDRPAEGPPVFTPPRSAVEYRAHLRAAVLEPMDREAEFWLARRDEDWIRTVEGIASRPQVPPGFLDSGFGEDPSEYRILSEIARGTVATHELGVALQDPIRLKDQAVPLPLIDQFRDLIFRNDPNDGTVRLGSQTGSLDSRYVTRVETPVVHSISPRYPAVQEAIIQVLHAGHERMAPRGFPEAGQQMPVWLPSRRLASGYLEGDSAICWSGMVWDHAEAFASVADATDAVVLVRPVNPDATPLIARNAATKEMAIKGKSSSWGPQVGFIPARQRFSKLWRTRAGNRRASEIREYDEKVQEVVDEGLAVLRELRLTFGDQPGRIYTVYEDTLARDAEAAIHLVRGEEASLEACDWRTSAGGFSREVGPTDCFAIPSTDGWQPMEALADPESTDANGTPRYLTADYDLLAIGFRNPPLPQPYLLHSFLPNHFPDGNGERTIPGMVLQRRDGTADTLRFDGDQGFITPGQSRLLEALNARVRATGYVAGNVSHHGPENHYSGSPYVDYPITAFEPAEDGRGRVVAIPMGPAGFRDIHLKRYLLRKRQEGYDLVPNPEARGWQWHAWGDYSAVTGWDPRDAPTLPAYTAELPFPDSCEPIRQMPDEPLPELEDPEPELPEPEPILEVRAGAEPVPGREPPPPPAADPGAAARPPADAAPAPSTYLVTDDLVAYFRPARDTTETTWRWRFVRVAEAGDTTLVRSGLFVPDSLEFDGTGRAGPDAPAPFRTELGQLWDAAGAGPGEYLLQTCVPRPVSGVFGQTSGFAGCLSPWVDQETGEEDPLYPWQDEGAFEVADVILERKGVVWEQGAIPFTGENRSNGHFWLESAPDADGTAVVLRIEWDACIRPERPDIHQIPPCDRLGPEWRVERQVTRVRFSTGLPDRLLLRAEVPAGFPISVDVLEGDRDFAAQIHDLRPRAGGPHRELTESGVGLTLMEIHVGGQAEPDGRRNALNPPQMRPGSDPLDVHLHSWFPLELGHPPSPIGELIRDLTVAWFIPVEFSVLGREIFAFFVYGPDPGPYDGPLPTAPGSVDAPPGSGQQTSPSADPGATGPVDPDALNPDDPDISGLIRQWLGVARPPPAVEPDNFYVYDEWGRMVGNGADGNIAAAAPPDGRGAMTSVQYVWTLRDELDSVDHCTVEEYVVRSLEERGFAGCRGRYRPSPRAPDLVGRLVGPVRAELEAAGHPVDVSIGDWPDRTELAYTILRQKPAPGERLRDSSRVALTIYGAFQEPEPVGRTVVSVYGLTFEDARTLLSDSGFAVPPPAGGGPAPSEDMAYRVGDQSITGGRIRPEGTEIRLTLFGPYGPRAVEPEAEPPTPPPAQEGPSCNDLVRAANAAQGRGDLTGAYELYTMAMHRGCRNPGLGAARESVYQSPRCTRLIRSARDAYDRNDFRRAVQSLRSAEGAGCDMSGLGPLVDGALEGLETGVAEALGRSCSGIAAEITAARARGDEATAQALTTTALLQGCAGDEITSAATTPLGDPSAGAGGPPTGGGDVGCYNLEGATVFGQDPPPDAVMYIYRERLGDRTVYHVVEQYNIGSLDQLELLGGEMEKLDWEGNYQEAVRYVQRLCGGR